MWFCKKKWAKIIQEDFEVFTERLKEKTISGKYLIDFISADKFKNGNYDYSELTDLEKVDCYIGWLKGTGCFDWNKTDYEDFIYETLGIDLSKV